MTRLSRLMIPLLFTLPLTQSFAQEPPPPMEERGPQWCQEHADECAKMKQHHKEFCEKNPVSCKRMETMRNEHEQWCKTNPEDCKKLKAERQARHEGMKQKMQERCEKNKAKCDKMKEDFRKQHPPAGDATP